MIKVLTVFGTRPEAIKLAPVIKTLEEQRGKIQSVVCTTSQHREMLNQVLEVFDIKPQYDLNIMKVGQSLIDVTTAVLSGLEDVLSAERPDVVLVQGDTTTTFAASVAAYYHKIAVGHVEAGLRTYDKWQPFPEEVNRRLTTVVADYHYAPTKRAQANLLRENIPRRSIVVTGNTGIDALFMALARLKERPDLRAKYASTLPNLEGKRLILVTAHRRENFGAGFERICASLVTIANKNPDVAVVYPVHPNPNIRVPAGKLLGDQERIYLIEPLEYAPFVYLLDKAYLVLTDSGGIQEEAPSLGKPVLVMRNVTERPEAIEAGTARLVGTSPRVIVPTVQKLLDSRRAYGRMSKVRNPFGDGNASRHIVRHLLRTIE